MRLGTAIECLVDNYKYASDKEWINDKVAWALYHTWKEADRKTENCSEKPNNCDTCRNKGFEGCEQPCLGCGRCDLYEPKDEPQTYVINPQEPTNDEKCFECDDFFICGGQCNKIKDEPQTDCAWK